jgi:hypothetical protein
MNDLNQYLRDGADPQARCILAIIQGLELDGWNVARWDYGTEQGYTIYKRTYEPHDQLNITFRESSESTDIIVTCWHHLTGLSTPHPYDGGSVESSTTRFEAFDFKGAVDFIEESMARFS